MGTSCHWHFASPYKDTIHAAAVLRHWTRLHQKHACVGRIPRDRPRVKGIARQRSKSGARNCMRDIECNGATEGIICCRHRIICVYYSLRIVGAFSCANAHIMQQRERKGDVERAHIHSTHRKEEDDIYVLPGYPSQVAFRAGDSEAHRIEVHRRRAVRRLNPRAQRR
eukprot:scaffold194394_cov30-Tisochrysis_lutea.AAC.2